MLRLPDPREQSSLHLLKRIQAGVKQVQTLKGPSSRQVRLPITLKILAGMQELLSQSAEVDRIVLWTVTCLAFFVFFHLGELLQSLRSSYAEARDLSWGDVAVDNRESPHMVQVHHKSSKSDQFGQGADVVVGRTGISVCLVEAMAQYQRLDTWPLLHRLSWQSLGKDCICQQDERYSGWPGGTTKPVCGPQLPDWRSYYSSTNVNGRLHHPDLGEVAWRCLLEIHSDS